MYGAARVWQVVNMASPLIPTWLTVLSVSSTGKSLGAGSGREAV